MEISAILDLLRAPVELAGVIVLLQIRNSIRVLKYRITRVEDKLHATLPPELV